MICAAHPLLEAIAAAVPGPPMAALLAVRSAWTHTAEKDHLTWTGRRPALHEPGGWEAEAVVTDMHPCLWACIASRTMASIIAGHGINLHKNVAQRAEL